MAANVTERDEDDWEFEIHGDGRSIHGTTPTTEASSVGIDEKGLDSGTDPSQMAKSRSPAEKNLPYPNTEQSGTGFRNMSRDQSPAGQNVLYPNTEQSGTGFSNMPQSQSPAGQNVLYPNTEQSGTGFSNMPQSQSPAGQNVLYPNTEQSGTGFSNMPGSQSPAGQNPPYPNTEHSGTGFRNMSRDQSPAGQNVLYPNTEQSGTGFSNMPQSQSPAGQNVLYKNIDNPGIGQSNMPQSQSPAGQNVLYPNTEHSGTGFSNMPQSQSPAGQNVLYQNIDNPGIGQSNMPQSQSPAGQNVLYPNTEQSGTGFSYMPQTQSPAGQNILYQNIDNPGIGQSNMPQSQSSAGPNFPGVHPVARMQGQNPYPPGYYPMHPYIPGSGDQFTNRGAPGLGFTSPRGSTVQAIPGQDSAGHLATSGFPPNMYYQTGSGSSFSTPQVYPYWDKHGTWRFVTDPQHGMYGTPSVPPYGYVYDPRMIANNPHQVPSPAGPFAQGPLYRNVDTAMQKQDEDTSLPRSRDFADSESSEASIQVIDEDFETMSVQEKLQKSSLDTPEEVPKNILLVTKLPKDVSKDAVSLYFENKRRSGGGTVEQVQLQGDRSALVYFAEKTVVDQVLAKPSHEIQKSQISVKRYIPEAGSARESPKDTIEVTVTKGDKELDKEKLELYFENTRSGGGDIKDISIDGNMAYITFDDASVVNSVLKKQHTIGAQTLHVSLHKESAESFADSEKEKYHGVKSGSAGNIDESSEEEDDSCFVLQVRNMKDTVSEEMLTLLFENPRRTGGGEIEKVEFDAESRTALLYFVEGDAHTCIRMETSLKTQSQLALREVKRAGLTKGFI